MGRNLRLNLNATRRVNALPAGTEGITHRQLIKALGLRPEEQAGPPLDTPSQRTLAVPVCRRDRLAVGILHRIENLFAECHHRKRAETKRTDRPPLKQGRANRGKEPEHAREAKQHNHPDRAVL